MILTKGFILKRIYEQEKYINDYKITKEYLFDDSKFNNKSRYERSKLILESAIRQKEYFKKLLLNYKE